MVTTQRRPQQAPRPNLAPVGVAAAIVVAGVALLLRLPGFVLLWFGLWVAALLAAAPVVLTGKKDASGAPTPGNDAEQKQIERFQLWRSLRWRLVTPTWDWLLNDRGTLPAAATNPQAPFWKRGLLYAGWALLPQQFGSIIAVAAAVCAFTFPPDRLTMIGLLGPETIIPFAFADAAAVYVVVRQFDAAVRRGAAPADPKPTITIYEARHDDAWWGKIIVAVFAGIATAAAVNIVLGMLGWGWLFWPSPALTAISTGTVTGALLLRKLWSRRLLDTWQNTVTARATWKDRWMQRRLDPAPHLISHTRYGDPTNPILVDRFEARAPYDATQAVHDQPKIAPLIGAGVRVSILFEENTDSAGQPQAGTKHPLRFRVVTWPVDVTVDITDPTLDAELMKLAWLCAVADGTQTNAAAQPMLLELTPLHDPQATTAEDGEPATAAWAMQYAAGEAMAFPALTDHIQAQLQVDMIPTETARVYVGALDERGQHTIWADPETPEELRRQRVEARWGQRWGDVLKMGEQKPFIEHDAYEQRELPSGDVIESQPFLLPEGQEPVTYLTGQKRDKLTSTLQNPGWVSVASWQHHQAGYRAGERHQGAVVVRWCQAPLPKNPAQVTPSRIGRDATATSWVLEAAINAGFDAGKLARPEVTATKALTTPRSAEHIWDITIRLYKGVTLADVKRAAERIRQGMGSCAWLRVTGHEDGCRIVAGANPLIGDVTFTRQAAQDECVRLNWEQAFTDVGVISYSTGQTPALVSVTQLPKNEKVQEIIFCIPEGSGLSMGSISGAKKKLLPATGSMWMDVSPGPRADEVRVLVCPEFPLPFPASVDWETMTHGEGLAFATTTTGEPCVFDWRLDPHLLILGGSNSGKSVAMTNFITGAILQGSEVYIADPEKLGSDFGYATPWLSGLALTVFEASAMMELLYAEVQRRKKLNGDHGVNKYTLLPEEVRPRHMTILIDEFTSLMAVARLTPLPKSASPEAQAKHARAEAENEARRNIGYLAGRIVREARSSGVTLILAGQDLKSDTLDSIPGGKSLKGNMSRLVLGKMDPWSLASALKNPATAPEVGNEVPYGRGVFESTAVAAQLIQAWWDGPDHDESMASHIALVREPLKPSERLDLTAAVEGLSAGGVSIHGRILEDDDSFDGDGEGEVLPSLELNMEELPDEPAEDDEILPELTLSFDLEDASTADDAAAVDDGQWDDDEDDDWVAPGDVVETTRSTVDTSSYPWPDDDTDEVQPRVPLVAERVPDSPAPATVQLQATPATATAVDELVVFTADGVDIPGAIPVTPIAKVPEQVTRIYAIDRILTWLREHPQVREAAWVTGAFRTHGKRATEAAAHMGVILTVYAPGAYPPSPDAE